MLNVRPGQKAVTIQLPDMMTGHNNVGITVVVDRLAAPGEVPAQENDIGPVWWVTSIGRPFTQSSVRMTHLGLLIKPGPSTYTGLWPDVGLKPILDDEPKVKEEDKELELN